MSEFIFIFLTSLFYENNSKKNSKENEILSLNCDIP